jgi:hypothetical protein
MTISRGKEWGTLAVPTQGMRTVASDSELAALISAELDATDHTGATGGTITTGGPIGLLGGDLMRTIGGVGDASRLQRDEPIPHLPIDVVRVVVDDDRSGFFVAHLLSRSSHWRGSWWRGPVVAAMNAQFLGAWDVAPRSHPNDGRVDIVRTSADMTLQQRWLARPRLRLGTHLPHPAISATTQRETTIDLDRQTPLWLDGCRWGSGRRLHLTVVPDAALVCV